jgi:hypothetical protein
MCDTAASIYGALSVLSKRSNRMFMGAMVKGEPETVQQCLDD